MKVIKRKIKGIQDKIQVLRQTTRQQYMERFEAPLLLSLDELKYHKELQDSAMKWLYEQGYIVISELTLPNHRRVDVFGYNESGRVVIVQVKVSTPDILQDKKWRDYLNYCDEFYFLVPAKLSRIVDNIDRKCGQWIKTEKGIQVKKEDSLSHGLDDERQGLLFSAGRALAKKIVYGY
jgi:hypothetical protein